MCNMVCLINTTQTKTVVKPWICPFPSLFNYLGIFNNNKKKTNISLGQSWTLKCVNLVFALFYTLIVGVRGSKS